MSWRIVYVTQSNKLSLNLNSLQVIKEENKYFVCLDEIAALVVEDYTSVLTVRLLIELARKGIPVLVLGLNKMPIGEYLPISDNVRTAKKISEQCLWKKEIKEKLWTNIIYSKISNQIKTLELLDKKDKLDVLYNNLENLQNNDKTNIEGISARVYFKELFESKFIRFNEDLENNCLNLTYHIVRTIISKEIVARGYNTSLGINHKSQYNMFNLSDDIIEVFRPIVDYYVYKLINEDDRFIYEQTITKELKTELLNIVNNTVYFNNKKYTILNVIPYYISNILEFIEKDGKSEFIYPVINKNV